MNTRPIAAVAVAVAALMLLGAAGCGTSSSSPTGFYVDDAAITSAVKSRMVEDHAVDATAIAVETQNGNVVISGLARNWVEKSTAESVAMKVKGVKSVQNNVVVQP